MKLYNHNVEKENCCRSIVKPNSNELFWPITEDGDNGINQLKLDMVTCRLDDAINVWENMPTRVTCKLWLWFYFRLVDQAT